MDRLTKKTVMMVGFLAGVILINTTYVKANSPPVVSNVIASQRTDGSGIVDINYTLSDADNDDCTVSLEVSDDGGSTWTVTATALSGDIGADISPGNKLITWDSKTDLPGEYGTNYQVKVTADDGLTPTDMALIPAGEFMMGDHHGDGTSYELPVHAVSVNAFYMDKYEITNQQYCDYLNDAYAAGDIKVENDIVYAYSDSSNSYPYCDTHGDAESYSQIYFSGSDFIVMPKDWRDMSDDPMIMVSWYGAVAYCNWLSVQAGYQPLYDPSDPDWPCDFSKNGYRLPTEAEWEYAARGGEHDPYYRFPWGDTISHSQANYYASLYYSYDVSQTYGYHPAWADGIYPFTSVVGSFSPNGYGLYDMAGNVYEWCHDWFSETYYDWCKNTCGEPCPNPTGPDSPASGIYRALRGGGWDNEARKCRLAWRNRRRSPDSRDYTYGFRLVLDFAGQGSAESNVFTIANNKNSPPLISNVTASQRTDGSRIVDINYTLSDADNDDCTVSLEVSDDGGSTWTVTATALSGDIGADISPGNKLITWDSKTDLPGAYGTNYRVKVTADDGYSSGPDITWVSINDPGASGHEPFNGEMSKYETTNAQYCEYLNAALASGDIYVSGDRVYGSNGTNGKTVNFSEATGGWDYQASSANSGTIMFSPLIIVDKGLGSTTDPLVGKEVILPDLNVSFNGSAYILTPLSPPEVKIADPSNDYFVGSLASGEWFLMGSASVGFWQITADITITSVTQTSPSASDALAQFQDAMNNSYGVDLSLSLDRAGINLLNSVQNGNDILGGSVSGTMDVIDQVYFDTYAADSESQITYSGGTFSVRTRDGYSMNDHPVVEVSWYGAMAFASYYGWRLPTEWEWQAVADYDGSYTYGCGTTINQSKANYYDNGYANPLNLSSPPYTSPVDYYSSYGYGMHDMAGNVWEWTDSCWFAGCDLDDRVVRGGSWYNNAISCGVSNRPNSNPNNTLNIIGFRVCRDSAGTGSAESNIFTINNRDLWYVDDDAANDPCQGNPDYSDPLEDGSAEHPFDAIQEAIDLSNDGDNVIVLTGIYTGAGNRDIDFSGKAVAVRSTDPSDPCVVMDTIIYCGGTYDDKHRGFRLHSGEEPNSIIEGLKITNGYGPLEQISADPRLASVGGAIFCLDAGPTIRNCIISSNRVGGGDPTYGFDGGPAVWGSNGPIINCVITDNVGYGALHRCSGPVTNCSVLNNSGNGLMSCIGDITNCIISGNQCGGYVGGGLAHCSKIKGCTISKNYARSGGGVYDCHLVENCNIFENNAWSTGGGLQCCRKIHNCRISSNTSILGGGGVWLWRGEQVINCVISHNMVTDTSDNYGGGGILCDNFPSKGFDSNIKNCIIWDNEASKGSQINLESTSIATVNYCNIQTGPSNINIDPCGILIWGAGNIEADPTFVDSDNRDYHLLSISPCINAGDPCYVADPCETDIDGDPRVIHGRIDMGSDEYCGPLFPDLEITSEDISFVPLPGVPSTASSIALTIRNNGLLTAENVLVSFQDFDDNIGSAVIDSIAVGQSEIVEIQYTWNEASFRLITVVVDPNDDISESNETNNNASKIYQVGQAPDMNANIEISCNPSPTFPQGITATFSGEVIYRIEATGYPDLEYPLKGGSVSLRIIHPSYPSGEKVLSGFTDAQGQFNISFAVPGSAGDQFNVEITATDGTYTGTWGPNTFYIKEHLDLGVGEITFSENGPDITIDAMIQADSENTQTAFNVPVTFYAYPPAGGSQIGSIQYIDELPAGESNSVSVTWENVPDGVYCIRVGLEPGFSDDDSENNSAWRPLAVPPPQQINVVIENPSEGGPLLASTATSVIVSVTDDNGNIMIPCTLASLTLQFSGAYEGQVNLKSHFDWGTSRYVYSWQPPTYTDGQVCLEVTAQSVADLNSLTGSDSLCVNVEDNAPPTFNIRANPYWARIDQVVSITIDASERLANDELNSITVKDFNNQPIGFSLVTHDPCSTRWVYQTVSLPEETARGQATITVDGIDINQNASPPYQGHFVVVDLIPDFWVHAEDIAFSEINPDLGETIDLGAIIHASPDNTVTESVPVTFSAHHTGGTYEIDQTNTAAIPPGGNDSVVVGWTPYAEGIYIIEVQLGPEFSDKNNGNNEATRAILVGEIPFVANLDTFISRERIGRTLFRYTFSVTMENLSPLAITNVKLQLISAPDNMTLIDPCVSYANIGAWESKSSADEVDPYIILEMDRVEPVDPAEIVWQITYDIADIGETGQQMSSTVVLLEPPKIASGDITGEGIVDVDDLLILAEDWLRTDSIADIYPPPPDGDDIVDLQDFSALSQHWLEN